MKKAKTSNPKATKKETGKIENKPNSLISAVTIAFLAGNNEKSQRIKAIKVSTLATKVPLFFRRSNTLNRLSRGQGENYYSVEIAFM
jgi:hypothetical protein